MRIPTTSVRTGLGMTVVAVSRRAVFDNAAKRRRGLRGGTRCRPEKTGRTPTILFPIGTLSALSVSLALDSSPKGGAKGGDSAHLAPQGAAPFRGSPQCAHWGKGSPDSDSVQTGKDRTHPTHSFPHRHFHSPGDPSVSLTLDSSPNRGAKGVDLSRRPALRCPS